VGIVLIAWRRPLLQSEREFDSLVSREAAFLFNNLILLGIAFTVTWGTLFPLLTEWLAGSKVAVGAAFFNQVNIPIGLALLAMMGIGPVIAWRKATPRNLRRNFLVPVGVGLIVGVILFAMGVRHVQALLTFLLGSFVLSIIVIEFIKGTRARAAIEGESHPVALLHLIRRNRRRWGGYIVHVGVVIVFMGFAGSAYDVEIEQSVVPGETIVVDSPFGHEYALTYMSLSWHRDPNMEQLIALFSVTMDGRPAGTLTTERQFVVGATQQMAEVGIVSTLVEDLYVILATLDQNLLAAGNLNDPRYQRAVFKVLVNPLVPWIWYGGLIVAAGTLLALWPGGGVPTRSSGTLGAATGAGSDESLTPIGAG
jgi:cytochrome c-type biogenesis protein CcmF